MVGSGKAALAASAGMALRDLGYRAQLKTDEVGDPLIRSSSGGADFAVVFYGCEGGAFCDALLFTAGFDLEQGASEALVNAWNRERFVGSAYVDDENDPFLQMFLTTEGGLTRENFASWLKWWEVSLAEFKTHVGF